MMTVEFEAYLAGTEILKSSWRVLNDSKCRYDSFTGLLDCEATGDVQRHGLVHGGIRSLHDLWHNGNSDSDRSQIFNCGAFWNVSFASRVAYKESVRNYPCLCNWKPASAQNFCVKRSLCSLRSVLLSAGQAANTMGFSHISLNVQ